MSYCHSLHATRIAYPPSHPSPASLSNGRSTYASCPIALSHFGPSPSPPIRERTLLIFGADPHLLPLFAVLSRLMGNLVIPIVLVILATPALFAVALVAVVRMVNAANERALAQQAKTFEDVLARITTQVTGAVELTVKTVGREIYGEREPVELPLDPEADRIAQQQWFLDDEDFADPGTPFEPDPIRDATRSTTASIRPGEMPIPDLTGERYP